MALKKLIPIAVSVIVLTSSQNAFASSDNNASEINQLNIVVAIYELTYKKYKAYLDNKFCVNQHTSPKAQVDRQLIELWLICEAAYTQDYALNMSFVMIPNNIRGHLLVEQGVADMFSDSVWKREAANLSGYITDPIFRSKEFEKGLYVLSDSPLLFEIVDKKRVKRLKGLGIKYWINDWTELKKITSKVVNIEHQNSLFRILRFQRADFTLLEFSSNQNMSLCQLDICLMPLHGLKVVFHDSRHMLVSKTSKMGKTLYKIANKGIKKLRETGEIRKRLVESRQINISAKDWLIINE